VKKFVLGTVLFLALGYLAGLVWLPDHYRLERHLEIAAPPAAVYATISDLHTWPDWTVWNLELDSRGVYDFSGRPAGDGAHMTWDGPKLKRGDVTLRNCESPRRVGYELDLEEGKHVSSGFFEISKSSTGSVVTWTNEGTLPGASKLMGPMLDYFVAPQLERGLQGLKARLEATSGPAN
jgi:uncharacterized protein YndB with AHSA1/START domain